MSIVLTTFFWLLVQSIFPSVAGAITISGFARNDQLASVWNDGNGGTTECDGATSTLKMSVNGAAPISTSCVAGTGAFTFTSAVGGGNTITIWMDGHADNGVAIVRAKDNSTNMSGIEVIKDRVKISKAYAGTEYMYGVQENGIDHYDYTDDTDIIVDSDNLNVSVIGAETEVIVAAGQMLSVLGDLTTPRLDVRGTFVGGKFQTVTLTASGTVDSNCADAAGQMPLCLYGATAMYNPGFHGVTKFTGTSNTQIASETYENLEIKPASGSPTYTIGDNGGGYTSAWTMNVNGKLTIGDGTNAVTLSTNATSGNNPSVDVWGDISVAANATLSGSGTGTITSRGEPSGAGTINLTAGTFTVKAQDSTVNFGSSSGSNPWSFYNLQISADSAFNGATGYVEKSCTTNDCRSWPTALDHEGNLYVAGKVDNGGGDIDWYVRKYSRDGALDTSWGSSGEVTHTSAGSTVDYVRDIEITGKNELIAVGKVGNATSDLKVKGWDITGTANLTPAAYDCNSGTDEGWGIAINPNGRYYVAGTCYVNGTNNRDLLIQAYDPDGTLSGSWGTSGEVKVNGSGNGNDTAQGITLDEETDTVYVASELAVSGQGTDFEVRKYDNTGTYSCRYIYNSSGANNDGAEGIEIDSTGKIYAGGVKGTNANDWYAVKLNSSCNLDTTWGDSDSGTITWNSGAGADVMRDIDVTSGGGMVAAGYAPNGGSGQDGFLRMYDANGDLNTAWGTSGVVTRDVGGNNSTDQYQGVEFDAAGNVHVAGWGLRSDGGYHGRTYRYGRNYGQDMADGNDTIRLRSGGTGSIIVEGSLTIGDASGGVATLDAETNDRVIDVNGNMVVAAKGIMSQSSTAALTVQGNLTKNTGGVWTPNTGTLTFDGKATTPISTIDWDAATTLYGLTVNEGGKTLKFDNAAQTNVTNFTASGASCNDKAVLTTDSGTNVWELNVTGTKAVQYSTITYSNAISAITATASNGSNNTNWTMGNPQCVTVSGIAYATEAGGAWIPCDNSTKNIGFAVNGTLKETMACDDATGSYSTLYAFGTSNQTYTTFLNPTAPGDSGVTYGTNTDTSSDVTGIYVVGDQVKTTSASGRALTTNDINLYDQTQDTDIPAAATGTSLVLDSGTELQVNDTFASSGDVTATDIHINGTFRQAPRSTLTLVGSGTGACTTGPGVQRPLCILGTFLPGQDSTVKFTGTNTVDVHGSGGGFNYQNVTIQPSGAGSPVYNLGYGDIPTVVLGDLTIGDGTNPAHVSTNTYNENTTVHGNVTVNAYSSFEQTGNATVTTKGRVHGAGDVTISAGTLNLRPTWNNAWFGTDSGDEEWILPAVSLRADREKATDGMYSNNSSGSQNDYVYDVDQGPDGSVYGLAYINYLGANPDIRVYKWNTDGDLATNWGDSDTGIITWNSSGSQNDAPGKSGLDVGPDGSVYVCGKTTAGDMEMKLVKYNPSGDLDTTWGDANSGIVTWDPTGSSDGCEEVVVDGAGNAYMGGSIYPGTWDWGIAKYDRNGDLDTTWGDSNSGTIIIDMSYDIMTSMAVDGKGNLYTGGWVSLGDPRWVVRRYDSNGDLDTTWGDSDSGMITYDPASSVDYVEELEVMPDGTLFVGGYINGSTDQKWMVRKYNSSGDLVNNWGEGDAGTVTDDSSGTVNHFQGMDIDAQGRLVATGYVNTSGNEDLFVKMWDPNGDLDTTWGDSDSGKIQWDRAAGSDRGHGVALLADGRLAVGGSTNSNGNDAIVRYYTPEGDLADGNATLVRKTGSTGTGRLHTTGLTIGDAADSHSGVLDLTTVEQGIQVDGSVTLQANGTLQASDTKDFVFSGDFTKTGGTLTPGSGMITLAGTGTSTLSYNADTTFNNFEVIEAGKTVKFDDTFDTVVSGNLFAHGGTCATPINLQSETASDRADIDVQGTSSVQYSRLKDLNGVTPAKSIATTSTDGGNNSGWTITTDGCTTMTLAVTDGTNRTIGTAGLLPNNDYMATSTLTVTTNNATGYVLSATDENDTWGADCITGGCPDTITDWTGTNAAPTAWSAGTSGADGYFGLTVRDATGGRLAKWGAGTPPNAESDFVNNLYAGLKLGTSTTLHSKSTHAEATDTVLTTYRVDPAPATRAGDYRAVITYTAVPNP